MLRVFVSSTFNDMHVERDCLENIQQDLNVQLLDSGERVEFVDLRWGICTEGLDEEGKVKAVLEGCFSAIDNSDFLLVFLGNRYGTAMKYDEVLQYLKKQKTDILFNDKKPGKSVTELEVTYAQLIAGFNSSNTIVCIRNDENAESDAEQFKRRFTENVEYEEALVKYTYDAKEDFKNELKDHLFELIKSHLDSDNRFERDKRRLFNTAREAILNSKLSSYKFKNQMLFFSGEKGIGKTITAAELLRRNSDAHTVYYVSWESKDGGITYEQLLVSLSSAFAEWFKEDVHDANLRQYIKNSVERMNMSGHKFVLFLDSEGGISNINYTEILYIMGKNPIIISTFNYRSVLASIPSFTDYHVFEKDSILFLREEIADVIRREFKGYGKTIRDETISLLCQKADIVKPLYIHFAVKRLLFLKKHDFERCAKNESPEISVLSEIAAEMPEELDALLSYSIDNVCNNSDIKKEMLLAIELLAKSHGGITEEALADYLIYNNVAANVKPYVYEIKNRLEDFILYDGIWICRKFEDSIYTSQVEKGNIVQFIDSKRSCYRDEYYIKENLYINRLNADALYSLLSARCLWKIENGAIRAIYRKNFWGLVSDGSIRIELVDKKFFGHLIDEYGALDEKSYDLIPVCDKDPVFRVLSENFGQENYSFEKGDGIVFLLRVAEIFLSELRFIEQSMILSSLDEIPMSVLSIFEKLAYVYKVFSKTILNIKDGEWNLQMIYDTLLDSTINYSRIINSLSCAESLIDSIDNRGVTYYHNAVRLVSASDFLVNLGTYDSRFCTNKHISNNGIYFNWHYKNDKVFDTVKYAILYFLTKWTKNFDREGSLFAMDIVAIDYYISYDNRTELMGIYNDALMLSLILVYEIYKLGHFRKYNNRIETYWIENYPYTRIDFCSNEEDYSGTDFKIRETVFKTIDELEETFALAESNEFIPLDEKCILGIIKMSLLRIVKSADIADKHKDLIYKCMLRKSFTNINKLQEALSNPELVCFLPMQFIEAFNRHEDLELLKMAVQDLNFNCL